MPEELLPDKVLVRLPVRASRLKRFVKEQSRSNDTRATTSAFGTGTDPSGSTKYLLSHFLFDAGVSTTTAGKVDDQQPLRLAQLVEKVAHHRRVVRLVRREPRGASGCARAEHRRVTADVPRLGARHPVADRCPPALCLAHLRAEMWQGPRRRVRAMVRLRG